MQCRVVVKLPLFQLMTDCLTSQCQGQCITVVFQSAVFFTASNCITYGKFCPQFYTNQCLRTRLQFCLSMFSIRSIFPPRRKLGRKYCRNFYREQAQVSLNQVFTSRHQTVSREQLVGWDHCLDTCTRTLAMLWHKLYHTQVG